MGVVRPSIAGTRRRSGRCCLLRGGALLPGLLLIPTLTQYGLNAGSGGVLRNIHPHWVSPWIIATTLARFLSFSSLEIARFIETDGAKRLEFFQRHLWLAPAAAAVWLIGAVQPIWMFVDACRPHRPWPASLPQPQWNALRRLVLAAVLLVYASYWFVMEPPQAHAFYVLSPLAFIFAAYWWTFVDSPRARQIAVCVIALNVAFHAGLILTEGPELSLYKNRDVVATAVRLKEPEMFAHRRDFAIGGGPAALTDPARPYDPTRDFQVLDATQRMGTKAIVALDHHDPESQHGGCLSRSAVHLHVPERPRRGRRGTARADQGHLPAG
jgi:hypothetical protein